MRFILALIIVYCHYFSYELQKTNLFTDVEMVNRIHPKVSNAFLVVEMFFIISGFFLYKTYKNHKDFIAFVKSKITRLWPGLFISTISLILLGWTSPIFQTNKYSELLNNHDVEEVIKMAKEENDNNPHSSLKFLLTADDLYQKKMLKE